MKMKYLNLLLPIVVVGLFFTSCKDNDVIDVSEPITEAEAVALVETDDISDDVNSIIDDFFVSEEDLSGKSLDSSKSGMLDCVTKTIVINSTTKTVTLDFGEGCELPNGNVLSGVIYMNYAIDTSVQSLAITYGFENFYFNELSVEGENTIVRVRENENGNPQSTLNFDMKVTWPDGEFASRKGIKVREWIEGHGTRTWGDNVFLITGEWSATFKNGTVLSAAITTDLRREMACRFIVSGVLELQKNEKTGTLDFGDGTCDNKALFTNEAGEEIEITLRKRIF